MVSDKTKATLGRGYISILHNLARMSLVVNDRGGYYHYITRAISPDPKMFNYNLLDTGLESPQQLEITLLFSLRSSYRYFMEGHIIKLQNNLPDGKIVITAEPYCRDG